MKYKPGPDKGQAVIYHGKVIGYIKNCVFEARRYSSQHLFWSVPGWAISVNVLEYLDEEGVQDIKIVDGDTRKKYTAKLSDFRQSGVPINHRGDTQLCLPLSCWKITEPKKKVKHQP